VLYGAIAATADREGQRYPNSSQCLSIAIKVWLDALNALPVTWVMA
jgi:hypothetical protein